MCCQRCVQSLHQRPENSPVAEVGEGYLLLGEAPEIMGFPPPCPAEVVWAEGIWLAALPCHCWEEGLLPEPGKPRVGWVALECCTGRTPNAWLRSSTQPCAAV